MQFDLPDTTSLRAAALGASHTCQIGAKTLKNHKQTAWYGRDVLD